MSTDAALHFCCFPSEWNRQAMADGNEHSPLPGKEEATTMTYGYISVSSRDQNEDRQLAALQTLVPIENIYMDKQSGKDFNGPQYQKMVQRLKKRRSALYQEHRPSGTQF